MAAKPRSQNFTFLLSLSPMLEKIAGFAEAYLMEDPNGSLTKTRQWAEILAKRLAAKVGLVLESNATQLDLLKKLEDSGAISGEVARLFHSIRKTGNAAIHGNAGDKEEAETTLRMAHTLAVWFIRSYGGEPTYQSQAFRLPTSPDNLAAEKAEEQAQLKADLFKAKEEIEALKKEAEKLSQNQVNQIISTAKKLSEKVEITEAETRQIIDQMLREQGWTVNSSTLTYKKGSRPQAGKNIAIAEWPCGKDRADYVLFVGLMPVAVVEAKRRTKNVMSALEQAERYSRQFELTVEMTSPGGPWGVNRIPFLYSTNGRGYLKQLEESSGIWFRDVRTHLGGSRALPIIHTPEDLASILKQDLLAAHDKLAAEPLEALKLRDYQYQAIQAVERSLYQGERRILLAMATGTGKTRTSLGLVYRLLKSGRFRRILFMIDREALGEQALATFQATHLEGPLSLTQIYDVKGLKDEAPEAATRLDIETVQTLSRRIVSPGEEGVPPVGLYDCIVVDECHRGYTLDRQMGEVELEYRNEEEYLSRYRRVIEHFDAVTIGLTATPALHTTQIFGHPVYQYSYRQAVVDGYLVDHGPPVRIKTDLSEHGIHWDKGETVSVFKTLDGTIDSVELEDEVDLDIEKFNKAVLASGFNKAVAEELALTYDLLSDVGKTLIFCVTDHHCDTLVKVLRDEYREMGVEDTDVAIQKITGAADKPGELIRRYKNEEYPKIAVTVDLLSTGIDVPAITNLVFIRQVRSRILYEQMLGRATRLCPEIDKGSFRIFDFVRLYEALQPVNTMKPVVVNPNISFEQLADELGGAGSEEIKQLARDQFLAKLHRRATRLVENESFTSMAGMDAKQLAGTVKKWNPEQLADYLKKHPGVVRFLDEIKIGDPRLPYISEHDDHVTETSRGYGEAKRPEDYLESFKVWVKANINEIPALQVVCSRPRELTRKDLKEVKRILDEAGFPEQYLNTAYSETNQSIAASVIAYIRQQALGSALEPLEIRVERGLQRLLSSRSWTEAQKGWLRALADGIKGNVILDIEALNEGQFRTKGGLQRINKIFDGHVQEILGDLQEAIWEDVV
ncbi:MULTISPECIES: type I restriction-modification system endonuclease [unclassified Paenibacillus]|uniref:type I restriction-modification system endonuclease n=1 Tax=unclassified Paenibacillus TaxID=185978 RepID=UPI00363BCD46